MTQIIYPQARKIGDWLKRRKSKCRLFTQKATEFSQGNRAKREPICYLNVNCPHSAAFGKQSGLLAQILFYPLLSE